MVSYAQYISDVISVNFVFVLLVFCLLASLISNFGTTLVSRRSYFNWMMVIRCFSWVILWFCIFLMIALTLTGKFPYFVIRLGNTPFLLVLIIINFISVVNCRRHEDRRFEKE